jgi:hypothetical protein
MPDYAGAGHLPQNRPDNLPGDPDDLPRQRRGTTPQMIGRYPDFDVLTQARHWDEATRKVVLDRVENVPPIRFFTGDEVPTLRAFCDTVLAQDSEPRIPVLEMVDARLFEGKRDGYRYAGMPDDGEVWRLVARGLDQAAGRSFAHTTAQERLDICGAMSRGELDWDFLDCRKAWKVCMRIAMGCFYSHPWAWNEIGFPGPAYPRGYSRLGIGLSESWEAEPAYDRDPVRDVSERGVDR